MTDLTFKNYYTAPQNQDFFLHWDETLGFFQDFFMLNPNITFILLCKYEKTAKNGVKVAKSAILGPFGPPLPPPPPPPREG